MNREIKFRIWNGMEMVYDITVGRFGVFYVNPENGDGLNPQDTASLTENTTKYHEGTPLMQFTGLKDKNGVEIYEGDILKIHHEYYDIRFTETAFCLFGRFGMWGSVARMMAVCKDIEAEIHVVGNIHDNPELLTK